jgi:hypothetical protein
VWKCGNVLIGTTPQHTTHHTQQQQQQQQQTHKTNNREKEGIHDASTNTEKEQQKSSR